MRSDVANTFLDLDELSYSWPRAGMFNQELVNRALAALWPVYMDAGSERLILARVVEVRSQLAAFSDALGGADITLVRLTASESTRKDRLRRRETGASLRWHLERTVELEAVLEAAALEDHLVLNEGREIGDVAEETLHLCGWLPETD